MVYIKQAQVGGKRGLNKFGLLLSCLQMNQATMASMPPGIGPAPPVFGIQPNYIPAPAQIGCKRCQYPGCDIKVSDCGCFFHAVRPS